MAAISDFEVEVEQINRLQSVATPRIHHSLFSVNMCVYSQRVLYLHVTVNFCPLIYIALDECIQQKKETLFCVS